MLIRHGQGQAGNKNLHNRSRLKTAKKAKLKMSLGFNDRNSLMIVFKFVGFTLAFCILLLASCQKLLMIDFNKATEITRLDIGKVQTVTKVINLPNGNADIDFVLSDYDCKQTLNATLDITIKGVKRVIKQLEVRLSELTWPRESNICRPIGYLKLDDENTTRPLEFDIDSRTKVRLA